MDDRRSLIHPSASVPVRIDDEEQPIAEDCLHGCERFLARPWLPTHDLALPYDRAPQVRLGAAKRPLALRRNVIVAAPASAAPKRPL